MNLFPWEAYRCKTRDDLGILGGRVTPTVRNLLEFFRLTNSIIIWQGQACFK